MSSVEQINQQIQQYAVCAEAFNDIEHNLQNDDEYDTIAPVT